MKLDSASLPNLKQEISKPSYDRSKLKTGIVHFGVGGFHRSHQAMYLELLFNQGEPTDWAICGVGVLPADQKMQAALSEQDYLYTLLTKSPDDVADVRVIGAIHEYIFAPENPEAVLAKLTDPNTRIVSLTVTEGGYGINNATGEFDTNTPGVAHDLSPDAVPATVFGFITEALRRRREQGQQPFTIMSCDNLQGNGHIARHAITSFASLKNPELATWIEQHVVFPNAMVDRITPATTDAVREELKNKYGIEDAWPVLAESFTQWVLEDHFPTGRPAFEKVGVQMVQDVEPYELMKLRLLNASHQAMGYLGLLAGYTYAHEVCQDKLFVDFLLDYMHKEAMPTLKPVPGIDLQAYSHQLIERFSSAAIKDTLARLIVDGSERIPKFLLPVVRDRLKQKTDITLSALVVASWSAYVLEVGRGRFPTLVDPRADRLLAAAQRDQAEPGAFLELEDIFGSLAQDASFRAAYLRAKDTLDKLKPQQAIQALM